MMMTGQQQQQLGRLMVLVVGADRVLLPGLNQTATSTQIHGGVMSLPTRS